MPGGLTRHHAMLTAIPIMVPLWQGRRAIREARSYELCHRHMAWTRLVNNALEEMVRTQGAADVAGELREANTFSQTARRFGIDLPEDLAAYFEVVPDELMTAVLDEMAAALDRGLLPILDWQPTKRRWGAAYPPAGDGVQPIIIRGPWPKIRQLEPV
jgi:hypothetical protein